MPIPHKNAGHTHSFRTPLRPRLNIQEAGKVLVQVLARLQPMVSTAPRPVHGAHVAVRPHDHNAHLAAADVAKPFLRARHATRVEVCGVVKIHGERALSPERREVGQRELRLLVLDLVGVLQPLIAQIVKHGRLQHKGEGEEAAERRVPFRPDEVVGDGGEWRFLCVRCVGCSCGSAQDGGAC